LGGGGFSLVGAGGVLRVGWRVVGGGVGALGGVGGGGGGGGVWGGGGGGGGLCV